MTVESKNELAKHLYETWRAEVSPNHPSWDVALPQHRDAWVLVAHSALARVAEIPIPMRLPCEKCGAIHVDEGWSGAKEPHRHHVCQSCGAVWQPALVPTVGVQFLPGFQNTKQEPRPFVMGHALLMRTRAQVQAEIAAGKPPDTIVGCSCGFRCNNEEAFTDHVAWSHIAERAEAYLTNRAIGPEERPALTRRQCITCRRFLVRERAADGSDPQVCVECRKEPLTRGEPPGIPLEPYKSVQQSTRESWESIIEDGRTPAQVQAETAIPLSDAEDLHRRCAHPDYEYETTKTGRKSNETRRPEGEGWEPNNCIGWREYKNNGSGSVVVAEHWRNWDRFEFHEEEYWMRRKRPRDGTACDGEHAAPICTDPRCWIAHPEMWARSQ